MFTAWLPSERDPAISEQVQPLRQCIDVLFMFQRKPARDDVFLKDTRQWLARLVRGILNSNLYALICQDPY